MNILLINHYAGSPLLGMEYRPYYMAREWKKAGHKVLIVAASNAHVRSKQFNLNQNYEKHSIEGIDYLILKTPEYHGNGLKRVLNMSSFIRRLYQYSAMISDEFKPDVVIASSTYPLDIYPAKKIADHSKAKLFFEVHDLWPLQPMEMGGYSKYHPYIIALQHAENYAYRNAFSVISIWPKALKYMVEHGLKPEKFFYIPNGIVIEEWDKNLEIPQEVYELIKKLKSQRKILMGYAGAHGIANALHSLVDAMGSLKKDNVELLLIGKGPEKEKLIQKANNLKLENIHFIPPVTKNQIPSLLDKLDILYIGLQNQPSFQYGMCPNKLIDYMMAGKPIIQSYKAGIDMVTEVGCGLTIEPENPEAIIKAVRNLISKSENELKVMGERGKSYCITNHDYKIIAPQFLEVLQGNMHIHIEESI